MAKRLPTRTTKRLSAALLIQQYQEALDAFDKGLGWSEKDGIKKLFVRFSILDNFADALYPILQKYYDEEVIQNALNLAQFGFLKLSEICWFCEVHSVITQLELWKEFQKSLEDESEK